MDSKEGNAVDTLQVCEWSEARRVWGSQAILLPVPSLLLDRQRQEANLQRSEFAFLLCR